MTTTENLDALRAAIDGDRSALCHALELRADGTRFFCPVCQADGAPHTDGDLSIEAGFRCHKCGWKGDGLALVRLVKSYDFPAALEFTRNVYGIRAGIATSVSKPMASGRKSGKIHQTLDVAAKAAVWSVEKATGEKWTETRRDVYQDAEGRDVAAEFRFDRADGATDPDGKAIKTFRPVHDVLGGWKLGDPPGKWPMFNLPAILASTDTIYVCEGPKAASAGVAIGLTSTTSAHGAKSPQKTDWSALAGCDVVILLDNDRAGRGYADKVAVLVHAAGARSVKIVELPGLPPKGDLFDFVALRTEQSPEAIREEIERLAVAAPAWDPPAPLVVIKTAAPSATVFNIRARLWEIMQEKMGTTEKYRKSADIVIEWLHGRGRFYYHAERRDFAGVMFFDAERKLLLPVQSDAFLAWLADVLAMNRAERSFSFVAAACETEGLSERATGIEPATYWAATPTAFYLSNGPGCMVRIFAGGVALVDNGTDDVLFPCGATLAPWTLTTPCDPFETCSLFRDMSTAAPHGKDVFRLWVCGLPSDQRTKPPLCLTSPVGGGKTRAIRGVFELYGMPERVSAVQKHGEGDFWVAMEAGGLACFDNCDTRIDWLAGALAAASTGGTMDKRKLYKDQDRVCLRSRSWVGLTSASPTFACDAGLADRLLVVRLNRRTGSTGETALSDEIARHRNAGLSWICQILSRALVDREPVPEGLNSRHPDFAHLAVKIGRAMGRGEQAIAAMRAAEADKGMFNLENDSIGAALLELVQAGPFNGTASELLEELLKIEPGFDGKLSTKRLGKRLSKLWPHLENIFHAKQERDGHTCILVYSFQPPSVARFAGF